LQGINQVLPGDREKLGSNNISVNGEANNEFGKGEATLQSGIGSL